MAYIGNDVDGIFIPESVNTSTKLRISDGDGVALIGDIKTGTSTTDSGIMFDFGTTGAIKGALFTEVDGEILSYGINVAQIDSAYDNTRTGGIFRLDTRPASGIGIDNFNGHCFVIKGRKEGELETEYNAFGINFSDGNTILVPENGNVGVGTTNPTVKLEVAGTIKATTYADLPTSLTVLNRAGAGVVINAPTATLTCLDRSGVEVSVVF